MPALSSHSSTTSNEAFSSSVSSSLSSLSSRSFRKGQTMGNESNHHSVFLSNSPPDSDLNCPAQPALDFMDHLRNHAPGWNIRKPASTTASLLDQYRQRHNALKQTDSNKDQLIDELIQQLHSVLREPSHSKILQDKQLYETRIAHMSRLMGSNPFVVFFIDGTRTFFHDELIREGLTGGFQAAVNLKQAVINFLEHSRPDLELPRTGIHTHVRLYIDLEALRGRLKNIESFIEGLSMADGLFDVVSCSQPIVDFKLQSSLQLYLNNCHCQQVLIAGYSDNVASFIRDTLNKAQDEDTASRLTLIGSSSPSSHFNHLFQSSPRLPSPDHSITSSPPPLLYAKVATVDGGPTDTTSHSKSRGEIKKSQEILRNRKGQRIDPYIQHDKKDVDRIKGLKLCNLWYLTGKCALGGKCPHNHGTHDLDKRELKLLELVARMSPCKSGSGCDDPFCVYGHTCPAPPGRKGQNCIFADKCRFPEGLHNIDRNAVKTTKI